MTSCGADPLRCDLQWVDGICYRVHPKVSPQRHRKNRKSGAEADDTTSDDYDDEPLCQTDTNRPREAEGKFSSSVHVPERYLSRLCGQQHNRRKELEKTTHTKIEIPKKGNAGDVVVCGDDESDVEFCIEKIRNLITDFRSGDSFTHFVSIPLNYAVVQRNLEEFKHLVLQSYCSFSGLDITEKMFVKERKLHLTVCCLCLLDKSEEAQAAAILQSCDDLVQESFGNEPFDVEIRGLEIMNDAPSEVNVLYAKVFERDCDDAGRLQTLCDSIVERFRESGFMLNKRASSRERIKLHMTLINSKFAEDPSAVEEPSGQRTQQRSKSGRDGRKPTKSSSFDATKILKDFGDAQFGIVELNRVELNAVALTESGTGYYRKLSQLRLPTSNGAGGGGSGSGSSSRAGAQN